MAEISAELTLKVAGLQAGLEKARAEMASFKKYAATQGRGIGSEFGASMKSGLGNLAGIIGVPLGIGAVVAGVKSMADQFDAIGDSAAAMNASVEGIQRLQYMAAGTMTPFETMTSGIMRIKRALFEVDNEAKQNALKSIGLDAEQFMRLDADQAFLQLAGAYQKAQQDGRGFAEVMALVKGASPDLFGAITTNTDALREMGDRAVLTAEQMSMFTDNMAKAKMAGIGAVNKTAEVFSGAKSMFGGLVQSVEYLFAGIDPTKGWNDYMDAEAKAIAKSLELADQEKLARQKVHQAEIDQINKLKQARDEAEAARKAKEARKAADQQANTEADVAILELKARGRFRQAQKMEAKQKEERDFQQLRDSNPEMGEEWARGMARRRAQAEDDMAHPGRIRGYVPPAPRYGSALDAMYAKGSLRSEMKFPAMDRMAQEQQRATNTLDRIENLLKEK